MNKKRIVNIIIPVLVLVVPIMVFINRLINEKKIEKDHSYTIATIYRIKERGRGGTGILFKYEVKGVIYEGSRNSGEVKSRLEPLVGKRFYVKFFNKNPKIYELLYEPVPFEIKRVPENGWGKIPKIRK